MPRPEHRLHRKLGLLPILLFAASFLAPGCSTTPTTPAVVPPLESVEVRPETLTVRVGETGFFAATAYDSAGNPVSGASFVWSTSDSDGVVLSLSRSRVTAVSEGSALVFATAGGLRDTGVVIVLPAQPGWFAQVSNANGANLNGVFFQPDGSTGWAVGDAGKILVTHDGGAHWTLQVSGTLFSLQGVWFTGPSEGWAVGNGGTVLHTTDQGETWTRVVANTSEALMDVTFASASQGWAVGSGGLVLSTVDGGGTWQKRFPTLGTLNSVAFAGALDGWAVGDQGAIVGTHDGGASWFVVQPSITAKSLRAVWRRSESIAYAAGDQGVTPRTLAGVDSTRWTIDNAGAANQLDGIHFPSDQTGFTVGFNGVGAVLRTDDGGVSWQPQAANTQYRLNDVFFVDTDRGWAVGDNGTILHTGTGGQP